jgi:hypothetical protein
MKRPFSGGDMATKTSKKKKQVWTGLPTKSYWHLYSLQGLESEKLARIVNKVLRKEYVLIK